jgi:LemA protein
MKILLFFLIAVAIIVAWIISIYNAIIRIIEEVNNNKKQIDIQLDRRFKVYESLIEVVKKYMDYEKTTLKEVVALRNQAQQAATSGDEKARFAAEDAISKIGSNIKVVFEQYPDLKADKNALQLQEEIVNTENKLTFSKQAYNDSVEKYNATVKSVIQSIIVGMYPAKLLKDFVYWGLADEQIKQHEAYTVKM